MKLPAGFTNEELAACVKREIGYREHVYPRRVEAGRMTRSLAVREIERMRAILALLEQLPATRSMQPTLFEGTSKP